MPTLSPAAEAMLHLKRNACLWPHKNGWCGQPTTLGSPYCPAHQHRARRRGTAGMLSDHDQEIADAPAAAP